MKRRQDPLEAILGESQISEGHPAFEDAKARALIRKSMGSVADSLKSEQQLLAEELLAAELRRAEAKALQHAQEQLAAARIRGTQQALAAHQMTDPAAAAAAPAPAPAPANRRFNQGRRDLLWMAIAKAQAQCENPADGEEVFGQLREMATARVPPLLEVMSEGLKWIDAHNQVQILNLKGLKQRLQRERVKAARGST